MRPRDIKVTSLVIRLTPGFWFSLDFQISATLLIQVSEKNNSMLTQGLKSVPSFSLFSSLFCFFLDATFFFFCTFFCFLACFCHDFFLGSFSSSSFRARTGSLESSTRSTTSLKKTESFCF